MRLQESGEMYIETIYLLSKESTQVRAINVGEHMGYSKPSVSRAIGILKKAGYVTVDENGFIHLTEAGVDIAERTYERHTILTQLFEKLGVNSEIAAEDACKIEHCISNETFSALKAHVLNNFSDNQ